MPKYLLGLALLLTLAVNSVGQRRAWTGYRVYSAVLNSSNLNTANSVVIIDQLEVENYSSGLVEAIKNGDKQMIHFYTKTANIDSSSLQMIVDYFNHQSKQPIVASGFNVDVRVIMAKKSALDNLFKPSVQKGWTGFYKKYPNSAGLFHFSKVYFSKDVTKAVFYYSHQQAGLKGSGDLVIMEKVNDKWMERYRFNLWQS